MQKISTNSSDVFISTLKNKRCVVAIQSEKDSNGALDYFQSIIFDQFFKLESHNIPLIFRKVHTSSEINEILNKIKKNNNEITTLVIAGHGNSSSIQMGNDLLTSTQLAFKMPKHVVLFSCSTGKENSFLEISLARKISLLNPTTTVISAKENVMACLNSTLEFDFIKDKIGYYPIPIVHFEKSFFSTLSDVLTDVFIKEKSPNASFKPTSIFRNLKLYGDATIAFKNGFATNVPIQNSKVSI